MTRAGRREGQGDDKGRAVIRQGYKTGRAVKDAQRYYLLGIEELQVQARYCHQHHLTDQRLVLQQQLVSLPHALPHQQQLESLPHALPHQQQPVSLPADIAPFHSNSLCHYRMHCLISNSLCHYQLTLPYPAATACVTTSTHCLISNSLCHYQLTLPHPAATACVTTSTHCLAQQQKLVLLPACIRASLLLSMISRHMCKPQSCMELGTCTTMPLQRGTAPCADRSHGGARCCLCRQVVLLHGTEPEPDLNMHSLQTHIHAQETTKSCHQAMHSCYKAAIKTSAAT